MKRTISSILLGCLSLPRIIILALLFVSFLLSEYDTSAHENLTAEERCGFEPGHFDRTAPDKDAVEISVWARTDGVYCWRAFLPVEAAKLLLDHKIVIRPQALANGSSTDADNILPAAKNGEGPDIAYLGNDFVEQAYEAGYIEPLDTCLDRYPEFDNIRENAVLWSPLIRDGKRLGIPMEPSVSAFFFSKTKLRELGWSDAEIDQLPLRIREGQFALDDMADVARQAVQAGVVQPGLGYWPDVRRGPMLLLLYKAFGGAVPTSEPLHLSRAVLERMYAFQRQLFVQSISHTSFAGHEVGTSFVGRTLYRDTVAHGKVLFWTAGLADWTAEYAANYVDELGGTDYLSNTVGYALFPSGLRGQSAATRRLNTGAYVILSKRATGRQNQDTACAVLAKVMTPAIYSKFALSTGTVGVLDSPDERTSKVNSIEGEASYFWDYVWEWPRQKDYPSLQYLSILDKYLSQVERGQLSPENAVDSAVREVQETLGDVVILEP